MTANPFELRPARRGAIYARAFFYGEAGHGKTYSAVAVGIHMCMRMGLDPAKALAVIDTETVESPDKRTFGQGSAEKYESRPCNCNRCHREGPTFQFMTLVLPPGNRDAAGYQRALHVCANAGMQVVVIDGVTDEWRSILRLVDSCEAQARGSGWQTARPQHNDWVKGVLSYPGHIIATCRGKRETQRAKSEHSVADVLVDQDKGILYEFDVALFLNKGTGYVVKTRDDRLENVSFQHPGDDLAEALLAWCADPHRVNQARAADVNPDPKAQSVTSELAVNFDDLPPPVEMNEGEAKSMAESFQQQIMAVAKACDHLRDGPQSVGDIIRGFLTKGTADGWDPDRWLNCLKYSERLREEALSDETVSAPEPVAAAVNSEPVGPDSFGGSDFDDFNDPA